MARTGRRRRSRPRVSRRAWTLGAAGAGLLLCLYLGFEWSRLPDATPLRTRNPPTTAIIQARAAEAKEAKRRPRARQTWVRLDRISDTAVEAVLVSEDDAFFQHEGVDSKQVGTVLQEVWKQRRLTRGASTITQQLAKNLWLSTDRSLVRKLKELVLAKRLESALTKERILELYLNVVEWGDGVYGIEAASREHFHKSAGELTPGEAAILAAMLPAPRKWIPSRRPPTLHKRAQEIIHRLERYGRLSSTAAAAARIDIEDAVGPLRPKGRVTAEAAPASEETEIEAAPEPEPSVVPAASSAGDPVEGGNEIPAAASAEGTP